MRFSSDPRFQDPVRFYFFGFSNCELRARRIPRDRSGTGDMLGSGRHPYGVRFQILAVRDPLLPLSQLPSDQRSRLCSRRIALVAVGGGSAQRAIRQMYLRVRRLSRRAATRLQLTGLASNIACVVVFRILSQIAAYLGGFQQSPRYSAFRL